VDAYFTNNVTAQYFQQEVTNVPLVVLTITRDILPYNPALLLYVPQDGDLEEYHKHELEQLHKNYVQLHANSPKKRGSQAMGDSNSPRKCSRVANKKTPAASSTCQYDGCSAIATFGFDGEHARFCSNHPVQGMQRLQVGKKKKQTDAAAAGVLTDSAGCAIVFGTTKVCSFVLHQDCLLPLKYLS
jgi:hypothetical protein